MPDNQSIPPQTQSSINSTSNPSVSTAMGLPPLGARASLNTGLTDTSKPVSNPQPIGGNTGNINPDSILDDKVDGQQVGTQSISQKMGNLPPVNDSFVKPMNQNKVGLPPVSGQQPVNKTPNDPNVAAFTAPTNTQPATSPNMDPMTAAPAINPPVDPMQATSFTPQQPAGTPPAFPQVDPMQQQTPPIQPSASIGASQQPALGNPSTPSFTAPTNTQPATSPNMDPMTAAPAINPPVDPMQATSFTPQQPAGTPPAFPQVDPMQQPEATTQPLSYDQAPNIPPSIDVSLPQTPNGNVESDASVLSAIEEKPAETTPPVDQALPAEAAEVDIFAQPSPGAPGQPPPIDEQGVDIPTIQQNALTEDEHEDLFGREKLSGKQKMLIIGVVVACLVVLIGIGIWIYIKINGDNGNTEEAKIINAQIEVVDSVIDTDKDGLTDQREKEMKTDPNNSDTDGDGYLDGEEVKNGYNPLGK